MAIKYYCDICKKELSDLEEHAEYKLVERQIGFLKHQKQLNLREMGWLFCISCGREMREKITELAKQKGAPK